jgi:hypothetical protein
LLVIVALGLPINDLFRYALLILSTVVIFVGVVSARPRPWLAAIAIVGLAALGQVLFAAPRIEEGHNVFIVDQPSGALAIGLPAQAFQFMTAEFEARYPSERRCDRKTSGCWRGQGFPDRPFAFSADGIFDRPAFTRKITNIDFSDPVWLRLGAINDSRYNWYGDSDLQRNSRERRFWMVLHRWHLTMPFFVMYQFPSDFVGSQLCWRGEVLWEGPNESFVALRNETMSCRTLANDDIGRRIFGVAITPETPLAIRLEPNMAIGLRQMAGPVLVAISVGAILFLLINWRPRRMILPCVFIGLSLVVVLLNDASFIGGVRPFDGGDDGLVYDSWGRTILQHLLAGDIGRALEGEEKVFYYGGPGLRYFRAIEHVIFGESYLGYLSLILLLPFLVFAVFRRFFSARAALALAFIFVAIPIGALFGSTFYLYVKWAARGFADPAAAILFLAGFLVLVGRSQRGANARFAPAFGAGLLFALALFVRPNLAPGAGVLLAGAGLAALWQLQYHRLAGMCIGFLPVFAMALHNWVYGGVFVLFSSNATIPEALPMPPAAYLAAIGELLRLDIAGEHIRRGGLQLALWLTGPSESFIMIPLHAAAIAILVRVAIWGSGYDFWLRLTAWAMLAEHCVPLFYLSAGRYYYLTWFLTLLICIAWMREEGFYLTRRQFPRLIERAARHSFIANLAHVLDWCERIGGFSPQKTRA